VTPYCLAPARLKLTADRIHVIDEEQHCGQTRSEASRWDDVNALLSSEKATRDMDSFRKLSRSMPSLEPVVALFNRYRDTEQHVAEAQELLADPR